MAGAGRRTFAAGEVLTSANVQNYLQDQAVMVFASTAARNAAIATPSEGMFTYQTDTNTFTSYDGSAWQPFGGNAAWTTFTPSITTTGVQPTFTYTTQLGAYTQIGKFVAFRIYIVLSGFTLGSGTGNLQINLPVAPSATYAQTAMGKYYKASTATTYRTPWTITYSTGGVLQNGAYGDSTTVLSVSTPAAPAASDQYIITGIYEAA